MGYKKLDIRSIIWQSIKNIQPILLFLMRNQILSTFTLCLFCYHFSVLSENEQLIVWVIRVWIIITFSGCLVLHIKILIVWMEPSIFRHLQFLISNFWCQCYWPSRARFIIISYFFLNFFEHTLNFQKISMKKL